MAAIGRITLSSDDPPNFALPPSLLAENKELYVGFRSRFSGSRPRMKLRERSCQPDGEQMQNQGKPALGTLDKRQEGVDLSIRDTSDWLVTLTR